MNWFKVGTKYMLTPELTKAQKGTICEIMALTSLLEREPTKKELGTIITKKNMEVLDKLLQSLCKSSVKLCIKKTLEDVEVLIKNRENKKIKMAEWRGKNKNVTGNVTDLVVKDVTSLREEKIREEKKKNIPPTPLKKISGTEEEEGNFSKGVNFFKDHKFQNGWVTMHRSKISIQTHISKMNLEAEAKKTLISEIGFISDKAFGQDLMSCLVRVDILLSDHLSNKSDSSFSVDQKIRMLETKRKSLQECVSKADYEAFLKNEYNPEMQKIKEIQQ